MSARTAKAKKEPAAKAEAASKNGMTRSAAKSALVLVVEAGKYKGVLLSRGKQGFTAYDSCDREIGNFETAEAARDAVLKALAA